MQIVIDIHEKDYQSILNGHVPFVILDVMKKGTVLPEHGRLIDADRLVKKYGTVDFINGRVNGEYINAPTILDATGVEE